MNERNKLLLRIDGVLVFVDCKVMLFLWVLINLYRNTVMLSDLNPRETIKVAEITAYIWDQCGSPFLLWLPLAIVGDVFLKWCLKGMLE